MLPSAEQGGAMGPDDPQPEEPARTKDEERHLAELRKTRQARVVKVVVALAIVILLIVFVVANSQPVRVDFVFLNRQPRLIWVMLTCAVLGGIVGYLIGRPGRQTPGGRNRSHDEDPSEH